MYSRNLFVLDFVRRFFVSCAQISEAYTVCTLMKFGCNRQKIGHKSKCRKDSESTLSGKEDYFAVLSDSRLERLYEKAAAYQNL